MTVDDFYKLFKAEKALDLRHLIKATQNFTRISPPQEVYLRIAQTAAEALARIGRESRINRLRVEKYGIKIEDQQDQKKSPEPGDRSVKQPQLRGAFREPISRFARQEHQNRFRRGACWRHPDVLRPCVRELGSLSNPDRRLHLAVQRRQGLLDRYRMAVQLALALGLAQGCDFSSRQCDLATPPSLALAIE
jgi:hypothetical protein